MNKYFTLIALISFLMMACDLSKNKPTIELPIYGEKKVLNQGNKDTVYHTVENFSFINQDNEKITDQTVNGKIYVANFFFATCQSICPKMSSELVTVQKAFAADDSVLILSHTVNPMHDTVDVLKKYAARFGLIKNKWHLLTGNKKDIYDMARFSYLVNALEDDGSEEGFLHSELFVLIDKKKRIRGFYDGTDSVSVSKLIEDIKILKAE
ncbi:MAG: SCO family protein [Bacteroidota bacterium]